jgi:hypothetical protein
LAWTETGEVEDAQWLENLQCMSGDIMNDEKSKRLNV